MPTIKINDINMYYETQGQGAPLILVSGFSANHLIWQGVVEQLAKHYQVITLDNRGSGQTDVPDSPYTVEQMATDVKNLCDALKITSAHFVGSSMGGMIMQALAHEYPEYVKSIVIANSVVKCDIKFMLYLEGQYEALQTPISPRALIKMNLGWCYSSEFLNNPENIEMIMTAILNDPHPFSIRGYRHQLHALKQFDSSTWVNQINKPCLVIGGDEDYIFSEATIKALAEQIPHAQYYGFKNTSHLPHVEHPESFVALINDFIRNTNS